MAATGKTPILLYGSTTPTNTPSAGNLTNSSDGCEIAINVADKNLFFKDSTNAVNTVPIRQSSASSNGWLSSTDWTTFNGKQTALVSGTNIKTVNGTSLLGSGDLGTIGTAYGGTGLTLFNSYGLMYAPSSTTLATSSSVVTDGTNLGVGQFPTCPLTTFGAYQSSAPSTSSTPIAKFREGGAISLWVGGYAYNYMWLQGIQDDGTNTLRDIVLNPLGGDVGIGNGNLVIGTSGKGIDFSATPQPAGMTSELLADYEEGTFTPGFSASGYVFSTSGSGTYTKVGRMVVVKIYLAVTYSSGSGTTTATITGLPYTSIADNSMYSGASIYPDSGASIFTRVGCVRTTPNSTSLTVVNGWIGAANAGVNWATMAANTEFEVTATYFT